MADKSSVSSFSFITPTSLKREANASLKIDRRAKLTLSPADVKSWLPGDRKGRLRDDKKEVEVACSSFHLISSSRYVAPTTAVASSSSLLFIDRKQFAEELNALCADASREERSDLPSCGACAIEEKTKTRNVEGSHHHFDPDELLALDSMRSSAFVIPRLL
mmetsp:Transcript_15913/g.22749  ORF Transcript_15913/g.22749 Transcript_15913/m.22749 type:complete len:162 (-) Transcript_15913:284-769(-)|eukprot:CAMPEP_0172422814 /NCGR_PEP_ID=MMETSP1064-20121228/8939_1 /TAXON_ID=202472 /ORGANISM="Aulacoseira subarctica , Strain CCAP 1002/5" /LENGTH=161 /DNA_ID=CAMNT_0013163863 /DNA_START=159 /DNA_END=644 /DNA_ORIENTATION=+